MIYKTHNYNFYYARCYRNVKIDFHNHNRYPLLYKETEITATSFGQILECQKCNILVVTQALVLCLICTHDTRGCASAYISGKAQVPMLQLICYTSGTLKSVQNLTSISRSLYIKVDCDYDCGS